MKRLLIVFLVITSVLFSQEETDSTFIEGEELLMEDEVVNEEVSNDSLDAYKESKSEVLSSGYKGLMWGASIDELEDFSLDTSSSSISLENSRKVVGILGQDSVTYTYHFSEAGFWKVVIDYVGIKGKEGIDIYISHFHRIEKALAAKYGPPIRTSQNELGTDREYLFSDFPKLTRAYFRSSWSADSANIELLLEAVVPQSPDAPSVLIEASQSMRLYYYNTDFYQFVNTDTTEVREDKSLSDVY